ncbi:unnamed protein product [Trichogramma brassicae]|uniref:Uncharacterized protein n=1 Tax=Trichogramma brassicae TaxID=86971 RepID=A0A6H5IEU1_9HYME|nr:unnamed protein product [Trichogramma brassicae]
MSNGFEIRNRPPQPKPGGKGDGSKNNHVQNHLEDRPASVPVVLTHQQYHHDGGTMLDRMQLTQPIAIHPTATGFPQDYASGPPSGQYPMYVSRDGTGSYRDPLYGGPQSVSLVAPQATYVTQPPQTLPPQPAGPAPYFSANKNAGGLPLLNSGYVRFAPPQMHYNQYTQALQQQQSQQQQPSSNQHSPNPQRLSQEYPGQPICQPLAQNSAVGPQVDRSDKPPRGPKPMVPPRINSKITHDTGGGHRKCSSVDVTANQKPKGAADDGMNDCSVSSVTQESSGVGGNPAPVRTRQDGLYVDKKEISSQDAGSNDTTTATNMEQQRTVYVSKPEHRKSIGDISSHFQKRNDTITFTFPGDGSGQQQEPSPAALLNHRKSLANITTTEPLLPTEQRKQLQDVRKSPMPNLPTGMPKSILISGERKSVEWSSLSQNQRMSIPQENRRSEYYDDHRRSPMTVMAADDVRRSPKVFTMPHDERNNQKSPNNMPQAAQSFEQTRAELALWAEQRQRQEIESRVVAGSNRAMYTTSPRTRCQSEERRPEGSGRNYARGDKGDIMSQSAFQPIPSINQNSLMEQRRHLRHVSADLTKRMELNHRKELEDQQQPLTGSVMNLGTTGSLTCTSNVTTQHHSNSCCQHDQQKLPMTIVTDYNDGPATKHSQEPSDHIIHSHHKKKHHHKSQENSLNHIEHLQERPDSQMSQKSASSSQYYNHQQHNINFIAEKLNQCERQQNDLQAKLQSIQNHNEIMEKVAQMQAQAGDYAGRLHNLHLAEKFAQKQSSEFSCVERMSEQEQTNQIILNQCINASRQLHNQALIPTVPAAAVGATPQLHPSGYYITSERLSPGRSLQFQQQDDDSDLSDSIHIPSISQMPLPSLSQFDRADVWARAPYSQRMQANCVDNLDSVAMQQQMNFTGTMKKVPPEKPPRTSLVVQSPDNEVHIRIQWQPLLGRMITLCVATASSDGDVLLFSACSFRRKILFFSACFLIECSNRSQPAIGLKHTSKARQLQQLVDTLVVHTREQYMYQCSTIVVVKAYGFHRAIGELTRQSPNALSFVSKLNIGSDQFCKKICKRLISQDLIIGIGEHTRKSPRSLSFVSKLDLGFDQICKKICKRLMSQDLMINETSIIERESKKENLRTDLTVGLPEISPIPSGSRTRSGRCIKKRQSTQIEDESSEESVDEDEYNPSGKEDQDSESSSDEDVEQKADLAE